MTPTTLVSATQAPESSGRQCVAAKSQEVEKWTARERIQLLLDAGSFFEFDAQVTHRCHYFGMENKQIPGDGMITGHGTIDGRPVYLFAQDRSVLGGSVSESGAMKICKMMDLAMLNGAPIIGLNDSGGARIQEGVGALAGYGEIISRNVEASGIIPQISAIVGTCAGGAAYSPAITDFIFMVDEISHMFVTGPDVIRQVMHEDVTKDDLGNAQIHASQSGVAHFRAPNEAACLNDIRRLLSFLPSNNLEEPPLGNSQDPPDREEEALEYLIPENTTKAYDVQEVITAVVDNGDFLEVHSHWAKNIVVGFARFDNKPVGIIASQPAHLAGVLDIDASIKAARFVRFCDAFHFPIITFVDVPGYLPGTQQEHGGVIRHGAKLLFAYVEATVPKITVILRKAYGGAYGVLGSKHLRADLNLSYPSAEIAVVGPDAAVELLYRRQLAQAGDQREAVREELIEDYKEHFSNPTIAAQRGFLDALIEPRQTRWNIIRGLRQLANKRRPAPSRKHGNIPL